jgi:hypothetical protein
MFRSILKDCDLDPRCANMTTDKDRSHWQFLWILKQLRHVGLTASNVNDSAIAITAENAKHLSVFICNDCNVSPLILLDLQLCPLTVLELEGMRYRYNAPVV